MKVSPTQSAALIWLISTASLMMGYADADSAEEPSQVVWEETFERDDGIYVFLENLFRDTTCDGCGVKGDLETDKYGMWGASTGNGGARVRLCSSSANQEMSAGYQGYFVLSEPLEDTSVSFYFRLGVWGDGLEIDQYAETLVGIDDSHLAVVQTSPSDYTGYNSWHHATAHIGHLSSGTHTIKFGNYLFVGDTWTEQKCFKARYDDFQISGLPMETKSPSAAPTTAVPTVIPGTPSASPTTPAPTPTTMSVRRVLTNGDSAAEATNEIPSNMTY